MNIMSIMRQISPIDYIPIYLKYCNHYIGHCTKRIRPHTVRFDTWIVFWQLNEMNNSPLVASSSFNHNWKETFRFLNRFTREQFHRKRFFSPDLRKLSQSYFGENKYFCLLLFIDVSSIRVVEHGLIHQNTNASFIIVLCYQNPYLWTGEYWK